MEMAKEAVAAQNAGTNMTLVLPRGFKRPPKFPRGALLCDNAERGRVYSFDPIKVLAWLAANNFIKVEGA